MTHKSVCFSAPSGLLCFMMLASAHGSSQWIVLSQHVETATVTSLSDHMYEATVRNASSALIRKVTSPTFIEQIKETRVIDGTLIVLGRGMGLDEVILENLNGYHASQRAIGYDMTLLDNQWIVSIEWYPNHLFPPQYPNHVVLVRKISVGGKGIDPGPMGLTALTRDAGLPVYPSRYAQEHSYRNVQDQSGVLDRVYGQTFIILPKDRLAFVAARGPDGQPAEQFLVIVDLLKDPRDPCRVTTHSLAAAYKAADVGSSQSLEIEGMQGVGSDSVSISFIKGAYRVQQAVVPIR